MEKFDEIPPSAPPPVYTDFPSQGYGYDQGGAASSGGGFSVTPAQQPPPVVMQPQNTTVVVQQQPQVIVQSGRDWSTGVCGCLTDCESCCCTLLCLSCYLCSLSSEMGEGCCMPCCIPTPTAVAMLRQKLRMKEKIHGSIKDDYCTSCCCLPCAICQLKREFNVSRSRLDAYTQLQG